jgi:hypothetical protein
MVTTPKPVANTHGDPQIQTAGAGTRNVQLQTAKFQMTVDDRVPNKVIKPCTVLNTCGDNTKRIADKTADGDATTRRHLGRRPHQ